MSKDPEWSGQIRLVKDASNGEEGLFIPGQADGYIPNGSRVRKVKSVPSDSHQDGALARVLSSIHAADAPPPHGGYFVVWDDRPDIPCFVSADRIERV